MNNFKLLIDTNVVIGLEDPQPVLSSLAELVRLSNEQAVGLFVEGANYDDVARDRDDARRAVTLSKLAKFQKLRGVPVPDEAQLVTRSLRRLCVGASLRIEFEIIERRGEFHPAARHVRVGRRRAQRGIHRDFFRRLAHRRLVTRRD
jgi:hypothetical protein